MINADTTMGFVRLSPPRPVAHPPKGYGELSHLYLDPACLKQGYGHTLFEFAKSRFLKQGYSGMLLWVLEGNHAARRFYAAHGMTPDGAREDEPDWLGDGVYEVRYRLPFEPEARS